MSDDRRLTPQERWHLKNLRTVSTKLPLESWQRFRDACMICGMTPYAAVKLLCESSDAEFLMMLWTRSG